MIMENKKTSTFSNGVIWFGAGVSIAEIITGTYFGELGFKKGILAIFIGHIIGCVLFYLAGLLLSYLCSFLITFFSCELPKMRPVPADSDMAEEPSAGGAVKSSSAESVQPDRSVPGGPSETYRTVRHGEPIVLGSIENGFRFTVTDPAGLHARPAGKLAELVRKYDCTVTLSANGKNASAASPIELLELGATQGTVLTVSSEGREATESLQAVRSFLEQTLKEKRQ